MPLSDKEKRNCTVCRSHRESLTKYLNNIQNCKWNNAMATLRSVEIYTSYFILFYFISQYSWGYNNAYVSSNFNHQHPVMDTLNYDGLILLNINSAEITQRCSSVWVCMVQIPGSNISSSLLRRSRQSLVSLFMLKTWSDLAVSAWSWIQSQPHCYSHLHETSTSLYKQYYSLQRLCVTQLPTWSLPIKCKKVKVVPML